MPITQDQLIGLLGEKELRGHFTSAQVYQLLAAQIRHLREKHQWTQADLGNTIGMKQAQVSRAENPDYRGTRISTLGKLAEAFDVALIVRFAPFSELADWLSSLSPYSFEPASYEEESSRRTYRPVKVITAQDAPQLEGFASYGTASIISFSDYTTRREVLSKGIQIATPEGARDEAS
jgi:transcriptional regulator with XRE-family HTH domain